MSTHERDVRHLFQRFPLPVPPSDSKIGRPTSIAHWSGAIGSTTMFVPFGMCCDHPLARHPARVGLGQHEVVVDAEDEALQEDEDRERKRRDRGAEAGRRASQVASAIAAHAASRHRSG